MTGKTIVLFEDVLWFHFYPFSLMRPVFDLHFGGMSIYEYMKALYPESRIMLICRPEMEDLVKESGRDLFQDEDFSGADECVFINCRAYFAEHHRFAFETCQFVDDTVVYLHPGEGHCTDWAKLDFLDGDFNQKTRNLGLKQTHHEARIFNFPWELVNANGEAVHNNCRLLGSSLKSHTPDSATFPGVHIWGEHPLYTGEGVRILPGCCIDTSRGPVYLGDGVQVRPPAYIEGPSWFGAQSIIDGALIRGDVSTGKGCRIGGEVEASILHDYSNKHHEGFIGHAIIGSWVNIGAMATNSDLRNDYRPVTVQQEGRRVPTGEIKVGSFIGDYAKIGIGVLLNTGCVVGTGANLFKTSAAIAKEVPGFVFGGGIPYQEYRLDRFMECAATMMGRRQQTLSDALRKRLLAVFAETGDLRQQYLT